MIIKKKHEIIKNLNLSRKFDYVAKILKKTTQHMHRS